MRFLHLADLHIGKRIGEFSMLEDQIYILQQVRKLAEETKPDGIFLAGDIYDRSVPPGEAVGVLDDFITHMAEQNILVFAISGNHDSPERLHFGSRLFSARGVHIAGAFSPALQKISLQDKAGPLNVYLLPFVKPAAVAPHFPEEKNSSYTDAVRVVLDARKVDTTQRNVLLAHQFVTATAPEDADEVIVGGLDNVDASVFDAFDYVALGHLHSAHSVGRSEVRYSGSPLKYSFSEVLQQKCVTQVDIGPKGQVEITKLPLVPLRDMREIKGPLEQLLAAQSQPSQDYIHAILTDEGEVFDAIGQLRRVFPNIMRIDFEREMRLQATPSKTAASGDVEKKSPLELFSEFYAAQHGDAMSDEQQALLQQILEQAKGVAK